MGWLGGQIGDLTGEKIAADLGQLRILGVSVDLNGGETRPCADDIGQRLILADQHGARRSGQDAGQDRHGQ